MVAWGSDSVEHPLPPEVHDELERALVGHAYAKAFPGCYIVALIGGQEERDEIVKALVAIGDSQPYFKLLVSPPREAGHYNGWLSQSEWDRVNKRAV